MGTPCDHTLRRRVRPETIGAIAAFAALAIAARWILPLDGAAASRYLRELHDLERSGVALIVVPLIYVVAGLAMVPMLVMIGATAVVFGPAAAFTHALLGCVASALANHFLGMRFGAASADGARGAAIARVRSLVMVHGVWAVAAVRILPIAPYSAVSLMLGALRVRASDVAIGSAIGMTPVVILCIAAVRFATWPW